MSDDKLLGRYVLSPKKGHKTSWKDLSMWVRERSDDKAVT